MARHSPVKRAMRGFESHSLSFQSVAQASAERTARAREVAHFKSCHSDFVRRMLMELHFETMHVSSILVAASVSEARMAAHQSSKLEAAGSIPVAHFRFCRRSSKA